MTNHIAILAPGLLGASVAQAARHFGAAQRITLWARRPETRQELKGQTWCDHVTDSAADAVKGAQLTIICSPVDQIIPLLTTIAPHLAAGSFVTDVGSVKTEICQQGHSAIFPHAHFVGSHPMAGSEKTGWRMRGLIFLSAARYLSPHALRPRLPPPPTSRLSGLRWRVRSLR